MTLEYERLHENLNFLGMDKMNEILDNYLEIAAKENKSVIHILDHLFNEECQHKNNNSFSMRIQTAHFPFRKTLEEFDFSDRKENKSVIHILDHLFNEECQHKNNNSFSMRIQTAHFPFRKTLEEFDF